MQGHFESWKNRSNNNFSQPNTNIASFTMANFNSPDNSSILDNSNPQTLNVKQSLQALRRINRLKASAMKRKQQLSTQNLVDHVNREAEIFDAVDHTSDEPLNVFTIKEQRHSNDFESDNESDHGNINDDEIENVISPPFLPESPPPLNRNDITYTLTDD